MPEPVRVRSRPSLSLTEPHDRILVADKPPPTKTLITVTFADRQKTSPVSSQELTGPAPLFIYASRRAVR